MKPTYVLMPKNTGMHLSDLPAFYLCLGCGNVGQAGVGTILKGRNQE